jgi:hypothetical protein
MQLCNSFMRPSHLFRLQFKPPSNYKIPRHRPRATDPQDTPIDSTKGLQVSLPLTTNPLPPEDPTGTQPHPNVKSKNTNTMAPALWEMDMGDNDTVSQDTLERWAVAYRQMATEARSFGIPASAIPPLPDPLEEKGLRAARDTLDGIIASFLSSGL